jgi:hypothetical protein
MRRKMFMLFILVMFPLPSVLMSAYTSMVNGALGASNTAQEDNIGYLLRKSFIAGCMATKEGRGAYKKCSRLGKKYNKETQRLLQN